jgi:hypothetical protein
MDAYVVGTMNFFEFLLFISVGDIRYSDQLEIWSERSGSKMKPFVLTKIKKNCSTAKKKKSAFWIFSLEIFF